MDPASPLDGRIALVTGGTHDLGLGITEGLVAAGAQVAVASRNQPDELPAGARYFRADVRDPEAVDTLVAAVAEHFGRLDIAVNNAGGSPHAEAATAAPSFTTAIVTLNLLAPLFVSQAANRVMQAQEDGGAIVNVGSVSGLQPSPGTAAYGAAMAGLVNLTQSLAVEWAPRVRVNAVSPGLLAVDEDGPDGDLPPVGRWGTAADVAEAVCFLASPAAAYVTGANLVLDGGGERPAYLEAFTDP